MEKLVVNSFYGEDVSVTLQLTKYTKGNLAIVLWCDEGPFATITVNLGGRLRNNYAFVDTNNCPWAPAFITKYNLGSPTGASRLSGYCEYPLYEFNMERLAQLNDPDGGVV